jgi:type I restriction enzyme M protein
VHRELSDAEIDRIAATYHAWRSGRHSGEDRNPEIYSDIPGFCKSATTEEIRSHGYVLTPGRYVGAEEVEDDGEPFAEKMKRLTSQLQTQMAEGRKLDTTILANLKELGYGN